ncbi:hypothetical protein HQN60_12590 [Deefgea piscis]|uniref:Uncharacterized protein n=1 Tax=Deefgea piscis TaxID=2739061 RepID=A0A6M8SQJ1_9NEIS|nr:hypothetical protein [Deefgea piscis]QKJ67475.1 hypothetical protein HQN60_12590 [Deefgea piscis]
MLLINVDAQLTALAQLKELEVEGSGGFAQAKYGEVSGGGRKGAMLPSGLYYQVTVKGRDDRDYTFDRKDLDLTLKLILALPNPQDREVLELVYLRYGTMVEKAKFMGVSKQTLNYRWHCAVQRFGFHWQELKQSLRLPQGTGVMGRFKSDLAANN